MKKLDSFQMEAIEGGWRWGEFFGGVCQGITVATLIVNPPAGAIIGVACLFFP